MSHQITVEHNPSPIKLDVMQIDSWAIWKKEISSFPWHYDSAETCYILKGEVIISLENGDTIHLSAKDLVTFPAGLSCHWDIRQAITKHYQFN